MKKKTSREGYVLITVLLFSVLILVLGSAAIYMSTVGSQSKGSEIQYQKAKYAAEFALDTAIKAVVDNSNACNVVAVNNVALSNTPGLTHNYSYFVKQDSGNKICLIVATGRFNQSKIIKTTLIPSATASGSGLGALTVGAGSNFNWNGSNAVLGNACGAGLGYTSLDQNSQNTISSSDRILGTPDLQQMDPNTNIYSSVFGSTTTTWDGVKSKVDAVVTARASSIAAACKCIAPNPANANCDTVKKGNVAGSLTCNGCEGGSNKTITISSCPKIALSVGSLNINNDIDLTTEMIVNTSNNLNVNAGVNGLLASDNVLNVSWSGNEVSAGIFIGGSANNATFGQNGNPQFSGMYFIGNASNLNLNMSGNTKILGSVVVNGSVNNFVRNGGGNSAPNIEYNVAAINTWGDKYPGLMNAATCAGGTPPNKSAFISKTKMTLY